MQKPKHNPEAELGVIGTLVANGDYNSIEIQEAMLRLQGDFFYLPIHKELFKAIRKCYDNKHHFDVVALMDIFRDDMPILDTLMIVNRSYFLTSRLGIEITELERLWELRNQHHILHNALNNSSKEPLTDLACEILFNGIQKAGAIKVNSLEDGADYLQIADSYLKGEFTDS